MNSSVEKQNLWSRIIEIIPKLASPRGKHIFNPALYFGSPSNIAFTKAAESAGKSPHNPASPRIHIINSYHPACTRRHHELTPAWKNTHTQYIPEPIQPRPHLLMKVHSLSINPRRNRATEGTAGRIPPAYPILAIA